MAYDGNTHGLIVLSALAESAGIVNSSTSFTPPPLKNSFPKDTQKPTQELQIFHSFTSSIYYGL